MVVFKVVARMFVVVMELVAYRFPWTWRVAPSPDDTLIPTKPAVP